MRKLPILAAALIGTATIGVSTLASADDRPVRNPSSPGGAPAAPERTAPTDVAPVIPILDLDAIRAKVNPTNDPNITVCDAHDGRYAVVRTTPPPAGAPLRALRDGEVLQKADPCRWVDEAKKPPVPAPGNAAYTPSEGTPRG